MLRRRIAFRKYDMAWVRRSRLRGDFSVSVVVIPEGPLPFNTLARQKRFDSWDCILVTHDPTNQLT